jgi:hypothetical protein
VGRLLVEMLGLDEAAMTVLAAVPMRGGQQFGDGKFPPYDWTAAEG